MGDTDKKKSRTPLVTPIKGGMVRNGVSLCIGIEGRDELVRVFVKEQPFKTVLDVGCGIGELFHILTSKGAKATGIDILPRNRVEPQISNSEVEYIEADFMEYQDNRKFEAVISSHVIEHIPDTERFLRHFLSFIVPGGVYCLIWPPPKIQVVGGHVHLFYMGTMLYNLVRIGVNCKNVHMLRCGYSLGIIGRLETFEVPQLEHNKSDIKKLSPFFPMRVSQGFDGKNMPGIRKIAKGE